MTEQTSIFDFMYEEKKITKPIRLIEMFAGIGSQFKALKQLTSKVESYRIIEWAYNSILSYNAIHHQDWTDYSRGKSKEEMIDRIRGISVNYNEPLTEEQLKKKPLTWIQKAYNNIIATNDLVDISRVHGRDLEIRERERYEYILTYSYPCQDLSLAGKMLGQAEGSGTRSSLLWEVDRILHELREDELPQILLMENVIQVQSKKHSEHFQRWQGRLEELGYKNHVMILNARDYQIPQNRRRCFMVSVLGDYYYHFPRATELKHPLRDFLEDDVDEKYYLSDKLIKGFIYSDKKNTERGNGFKLRPTTKEAADTAFTITTKAGSRVTDNFILEEVGTLDIKGQDNIKRVYNPDGLSPTLTTMNGGNRQPKIAIKNATKQGYLLAEEGDGIDIAQRSGHRGTVQRGMAQTLKTQIDVGVVTEEMRIRKLTPTECLTLMGFEKRDSRALEEIGISDQGRYHVAGDSIVVTVLIAIFGQMLTDNKTAENIIAEYVENLIGGAKNE